MINNQFPSPNEVFTQTRRIDPNNPNSLPFSPNLNQGIGSGYTPAPSPFVSSNEKARQLFQSVRGIRLYLSTLSAIDRMSAGDWYECAHGGFRTMPEYSTTGVDPSQVLTELKTIDFNSLPQGVKELYTFVETTANELITANHN